jgi:hypothetical protein
MSIDTSEIGIVASKVMDDLEAMQKSGDAEEDARVVAVLVTYEIRSAKESTSTVGGRCTDNSSVLGLGLMERMKYTMLSPDSE